MPHPLVDQLRFTRLEWRRGLDGVSDVDARRRLAPMNCLSWMVGHLAWHEQLCWIERLQGGARVVELDELVGSGRPASTPPQAEMWQAWQAVTRAADPVLDRLAGDDLLHFPVVAGQPGQQSVGTLLRRLTYHYWFHVGEALAVRQLLGHPDLPNFVGDLDLLAPYRPEEREDGGGEHARTAS